MCDFNRLSTRFYSDRIGGWDGVAILAGSHLFGKKQFAGKSRILPTNAVWRQKLGQAPDTPVKFYVTAMLFILFDIDVVFLIPWVLTHRELTAAGVSLLWPMLFFTFVLAVGLIYELKSGALEWEK